MDAPGLSDDEANALQDAHLALAVEVMTWMVPAGNIHFDNVPAPRSMAEAAED